MEKLSKEEWDNPEFLFRHILAQKATRHFSLSEVEEDWRELTGQEPPELLEESLEALVKQKVLIKDDEGLYYELPF